MTEEQAKQSKLAASTAILAAVMVATLSSGTGNSSSEGKRVFGSVAYERLLPKGDCHCVEKTSKKLQPLDDIVHVWVRDARSFRHGKDSTVPYFSLRVAVSIPVSELRSLVQKQFALLSPYKREVDGELQLCFDDYILDDDQPFSTYLPDGEASSSSNSKGATRRPSTWPKPFAGILWVMPWRPARKQPVHWASGKTPELPKSREELPRNNLKMTQAPTQHELLHEQESRSQLS